jgi:hypothetical protein
VPPTKCFLNDGNSAPARLSGGSPEEITYEYSCKWSEKCRLIGRSGAASTKGTNHLVA